MLPVLKKPIEPHAILNVLQELKLGHAPPTAGRIGLDEALNQRLDRILVSAEDRPAQEAACRRRIVRPRAPSAARHHDAGRVHAGRHRRRPLIKLAEHSSGVGIQSRTEFRQARRQPADGGQHIRRGAWQGAVSGNLADLSPAIRQMAGSRHRRDGRAARRRSGASQRYRQRAQAI